MSDTSQPDATGPAEDTALETLTPQPITVTADAYDQLVDALDAPDRPTPKLDALMAHEPRWS